MKWTFLGATVAGVLAGIVSSAGLPFMVRYVFPLIFVDSGTDVLRPMPTYLQDFTTFLFGKPLDQSFVLSLACLILPATFLVRGFFLFINGYYLSAVGLRIVQKVRIEAFSRLQNLSLSFHQSCREGDLISRIISDSALLQKTLVSVAADLVIQPATLLGSIGILIYLALSNQGALFMLAALLSLPILLIPLRAYGAAIISKARRTQAKAGDLTAYLSENLGAQPEIRTYNLQDKQIKKFSFLSDQLVRFELKTVKYNKLIGPTVEIVSALAIGFSVYLAAGKGISIDVFLPMVMALYFAYDPLKKLGLVMGQLKQAEACLERISIITDCQDELAEPTKPMSFDAVDGGITFKKVSFQYSSRP